jgi:hypothetical protein
VRERELLVGMVLVPEQRVTSEPIDRAAVVSKVPAPVIGLVAQGVQKVAVAEIRLGITVSHPDRVATLLAVVDPREAQPKRPAVAEAPA